MLALYRVFGLWSIAKFHLSTKMEKRDLILSGTCEANFLIFSLSDIVNVSISIVLAISLIREFDMLKDVCTSPYRFPIKPSLSCVILRYLPNLDSHVVPLYLLLPWVIFLSEVPQPSTSAL